MDWNCSDIANYVQGLPSEQLYQLRSLLEDELKNRQPENSSENSSEEEEEVAENEFSVEDMPEAVVEILRDLWNDLVEDVDFEHPILCTVRMEGNLDGHNQISFDINVEGYAPEEDDILQHKHVREAYDKLQLKMNAFNTTVQQYAKKYKLEVDDILNYVC